MKKQRIQIIIIPLAKGETGEAWHEILECIRSGAAQRVPAVTADFFQADGFWRHPLQGFFVLLALATMVGVG